MASVSSPTLPHTRYKKNQNPRKSNPSKFLSPTTRHSTYPILYYVPVFSNTHNNRVSSPSICRCNKNSDSPLDDNVDRRWKLEDMVKNVMTRIENYLNSSQKRDDDKSVELEAKEEKLKEEESNGSGEWDWERWKKHFEEIDEQEKIVSVLKSQLGKAVHREEYEYASKLKVAVAAATTNDIVGRVFNQFNRAIEEERYQDAAFLRDHAGAGLMGWWAGIPEDLDDPYGRIIHIGVEHGRYVARSFSPRHLATASPGVPLFEIFLTLGPEGEYKQQAVYLKRNGRKFDGLTNLSKSLDPSSKISQLNGSDDVKSQGSDDVKGQQSPNSEDTDDKDDDSDVAEGLAGVQNILRDIDPDAKVTVLEVSAPGKVSKDLILNVIEQYLDTDDEEDADNVADEQEEIDEDFESLETDEDDVKAESSQDEGELYTGDEESGSDIENERSEMEINVEIEDEDEGSDNDNGKEPSDMQIKVVIGGRLQTLASDAHAKSLLRVPARLEKKNRLSFSFSIEDDDKELEASNKEHVPHNKTLLGRQSIHNVMSDLAKYAIKREKIPMKVLKGVEDFISLTLNQAKNRQPLAGTTKFNRIEIPASSDILNGLYIGAHGLYTPEVIHLSRKFGHWQEDGPDNKLSDIEFYEYVEAVKLTGDPYVPAGQIAFRAKVGKQYQLPHKGIIPEEFGVVARYKGQGRLAEPGFKNPRWVDGELVILNGKYIKGGPVVGFVYWAPDYQFLVFFNRLRLPK